jgi:hypothetical protein
LVNDDTVARLLASAKREIELTIGSDEFSKLSSSLISDFDGIVANIKDIHESVSGLAIPKLFEKSVISPVRQRAIAEVASFLSQKSLQANVVEPLTKVLFESVQFGYTISDAQDVLEDALNLGKYVGQIARDSFFQFDGTINNLIADKYELDGFRYVGSLVDDSRGQCKRWTEIGKIPKEALSKEISWAKRSGEYKGRKKSGMIPETNTQNFATYRGGYNCRHRAIPVRLSAEDIERYEKKYSAF